MSWTRKTLADQVMEAFSFDLDRLWGHLVNAGMLPVGLPHAWDPIDGEQGALPHLNFHRSTSAVAAKGREVRRPCKLCGVARVVLGCLWAIKGPELPHSLVFVRELKKAVDEIAKIGRRLNNVGLRYEREQKAEFQRFVEQQQAELLNRFREQHQTPESRKGKQEEVLKQNQARLAELQGSPEIAGVWNLKKLGGLDESLKQTAQHLRIIIDDVLVDLRGLLDVDAWTPRKGGKMKMVTLVEKTLRKDGFSWKEIADLVEEDDSREAIDRVRARVEGRGGKTTNKSR